MLSSGLIAGTVVGMVAGVVREQARARAVGRPSSPFEGALSGAMLGTLVAILVLTLIAAASDKRHETVVPVRRASVLGWPFRDHFCGGCGAVAAPAAAPPPAM